jgi:hypothetical protein
MMENAAALLRPNKRRPRSRNDPLNPEGAKLIDSPEADGLKEARDTLRRRR